MPRAKLTKRVVDAIGSVDRVTYYYDTDLPGFFFRLQPGKSGSRMWGFEYRAGSGREAPKKRVTIGAFGKLTPDQARTAAKRLAADVVHGNDPAAQKAAKAREMTIVALIDLYDAEGCFVQRGVRQGEPMKPRTKAYTLARLRHHVVPLLGRKRARDINAGDIERLVRDVAAGKTARREKIGPRRLIVVRGGEGAARKVARDLSAVFSFAGRRGVVAANPCETAAIRKTDNSRTRFLTLDEVKRLGAAFDALAEEGTNPKALNIARLWALTGCRRDEIAALRWPEIDFEHACLELSASKTGRSVRPLGAPALVLLASIARDPASEFVFPAESGEGFYQGTKRVWPKVIARAQLPGVTPHTLRHTLGSASVSSGETLSMTGALLGHVTARATQIYAHISRAPSKSAADRVTETIAAALERRPEAEVMPMKANAKG